MELVGDQSDPRNSHDVSMDYYQNFDGGGIVTNNVASNGFNASTEESDSEIPMKRRKLMNTDELDWDFDQTKGKLPEKRLKKHIFMFFFSSR